MSKRVFDYVETTKIGIEGPINLLERIAANVEGEKSPTTPADCSITIYQSPNPTKILKDKNFPYLTLERGGTPDKPTISYTRYNTHVRTIYQNSPQNYYVEANVALDESSGLICIRNYLSSHSELSQHPLLHASLITFDGRGVLIAGDSRQGKTTSTIYFLEDGASFVGDENIALDMNNNRPRGLYIPRTPRVRFSTIAESRLSAALDDINLTEATQYIDPDAIERIISSRNFYVDAGMAFSRRAFCKLLGTKSAEQSSIDLVVFPKYTPSGKVSKKKLSLSDGINRLSHSGLKRKSDIDPKELTDTQITLSPEAFLGIEFLELEFSGITTLRDRGIRL